MEKIIKKNLLLCLLICCGLLVFLNYKFDFINKIKITMESGSQHKIVQKSNQESTPKKNDKTLEIDISPDCSTKVMIIYKTEYHYYCNSNTTTDKWNITQDELNSVNSLTKMKSILTRRYGYKEMALLY